MRRDSRPDDFHNDEDFAREDHELDQPEPDEFDLHDLYGGDDDGQYDNYYDDYYTDRDFGLDG